MKRTTITMDGCGRIAVPSDAASVWMSEMELVRLFCKQSQREGSEFVFWSAQNRLLPSRWLVETSLYLCSNPAQTRLCDTQISGDASQRQSL